MQRALFIDYVAGPAVGKSTLAALTFGEIKMRRKLAEWSTEVAKELVWAEEFDILNNQHEVSRKQYESFRSKADKVDFVVTDGSLIHALYYNRANPDNVCNVERTERDILKWHREFRHLVIYLEREPDAPYEQTGRIQNEQQALDVDRELIHIMNNHQIEFVRLPAGRDTVERVVEMALSNRLCF